MAKVHFALAKTYQGLNNPKKCEKHMEQAAELGHADAAYACGKAQQLRESQPGIVSKFTNLTRTSSLDYYQMAEQAGHRSGRIRFLQCSYAKKADPHIAFEIGNYYLKGDRDLKKALKYFTVATQGKNPHPDAQNAKEKVKVALEIRNLLGINFKDGDTWMKLHELYFWQLTDNMKSGVIDHHVQAQSDLCLVMAASNGSKEAAAKLYGIFFEFLTSTRKYFKDSWPSWIQHQHPVPKLGPGTSTATEADVIDVVTTAHMPLSLGQQFIEEKAVQGLVIAANAGHFEAMTIYLDLTDRGYMLPDQSPSTLLKYQQQLAALKSETNS